MFPWLNCFCQLSITFLSWLSICHCLSWKISIILGNVYLKGLVYCLSHNSIFDIYRVVLTAHCRSDHQGMVLIYWVGPLILYHRLLLVTVKSGKPWTPKIFLECYFVARKKRMRREKTKLQARTLIISLLLCGQFTRPDLCSDCMVITQ